MGWCSIADPGQDNLGFSVLRTDAGHGARGRVPILTGERGMSKLYNYGGDFWPVRSKDLDERARLQNLREVWRPR